MIYSVHTECQEREGDLYDDCRAKGDQNYTEVGTNRMKQGEEAFRFWDATNASFISYTE